MEKNFTESLGTRVRIEKSKTGGTVTIDFFSPEDLRALLLRLNNDVSQKTASTPGLAADSIATPSGNSEDRATEQDSTGSLPESGKPIDDRSAVEIEKDENEDLYSLKNFSV
jgi:hypothetical protein